MTTRRDILRGGAGLAAILAAGKAPAAFVKSMLAARNIIGMKSGGAKLPTAADYVQDGLVAMWDGIENAGWGLHSDTISSWYDLVSRYNMGFLGGDDKVIENDGIKFNPRTTDNPARARTSNQFSIGQDLEKTLSLCASVNGEWDDTLPFMFLCGTNSGFAAKNGRIYARRNGSTSWQDVGVTYTTGTKFRVLIVQTNSSVDVYSGKNLIGSNIGNMTYFSLSGWMQVCSYNSSLPACATIHNVSLWNRALTAAEVAANNAVDKARFNLA